MKKLSLIGKKFNRLTVIDYAGILNQHTRWVCVCDCGNKRIVLGFQLTTGQVKSCGCSKKELISKANFRHGQSYKTSEYVTWVNIKTRCYNKKVNDPDYLGKGIKVCDRWLDKKNGFINFICDMGKKPTSSHSIERNNSNGNYEPNNCRWATVKEQVRNKSNNNWITYNDRRMILQDWANYFGVHQANLTNSLKSKSIKDVYEFYYKKYNGVFPNGDKVKNIATPNYNKPKPIIATKIGLPILIESKSIREMSRITQLHHHIIELSILNNKPYKDWAFKYL